MKIIGSALKESWVMTHKLCGITLQKMSSWSGTMNVYGNHFIENWEYLTISRYDWFKLNLRHTVLLHREILVSHVGSNLPSGQKRHLVVVEWYATPLTVAQVWLPVMTLWKIKNISLLAQWESSLFMCLVMIWSRFWISFRKSEKFLKVTKNVNQLRFTCIRRYKHV